ncbi:RagB/SusD family nutrient uptake outer membrane protein [Pedobacter hiemivivus]|nr:RagB/SusD family nutrient uptake outer membrane protein [Pedobacter hiemivivus]
MINSSCKKLISIPDPNDTMTTTQIFSNDKDAESSIAGVYSKMAYGPDDTPTQNFSSGLITILGGLSSGELFHYAGPTGETNFYPYSTNKLNINNSNSSYKVWSTAYTTIYGANSVMEGVEASTSSLLSDSVRKELTGEAKFVRAFTYFYLSNLFGDVPLALTINFHKTISLPRAPQRDVYLQIIKDLKDAMTLMPADYSVGKGKRTRPNKWAAAALLARVYLYTGDYINAAALSTEIINTTSLFKLEADLNNVFSTISREAIWQLGLATGHYFLRNATPEGNIMVPAYSTNTGTPIFGLSQELKNAFETGDERWVKWTGNTDNSMATGSPQGTTWYPYKYKLALGSSVVGGPEVEYYTPMRLAEQYLIRAEAIVNGAPGGLSAAIDDLNIIRDRADLPALPYTLNKIQVMEAIAKERQVELFAEWGHRWLDLKRTGRAHDVLITNPLKLPWIGDHQLLYPIPLEEIMKSTFLIQTPGY